MILERVTRRGIEETWAVFSDGLSPNPALWVTRLADLTRSTAFLWTESGLGVQERLARRLPAGQSVARGLVLGTVTADIAAGYGSLQARAAVLAGLVRDEDWQLQHQRGANRVVDTAATLGGALLKACQFAATRPDLLPATYIRTLAPLQDRLPPRDWPEIERAIRRELGQRPGDLFAWIDPKPIAAASIAQVHRARLHDGREVAVKVQYPDIANLVATDLAALRNVVALVARGVPALQLQPIVDYLEATLPLELDFRHEAESMIALRAALAHRPDVVVPAVLPELSTGRVLVMDYVEGIKITDRAGLEAAGINPAEVAALLNDVYAEQMLRGGILHADPHPGNLRVQPGPRLVLLDHGLTVALPPPLAATLRAMVQALATGDFAALAAALQAAGLPLDAETDITTLLRLVGVLLGTTPGEMPGGFGLGKALSNLPPDLVLVGRALGLLDGITRQLDPTLNTIAIVARYA